MVDVAQLVRASDCGSEGRGFEPLLPPQGAGKESARKTKALYIPGYVRLFRFLGGKSTTPPPNASSQASSQAFSRLPVGNRPPFGSHAVPPVRRPNPPIGRTGPFLAVGVIPTPKEARKNTTVRSSPAPSVEDPSLQPLRTGRDAFYFH